MASTIVLKTTDKYITWECKATVQCNAAKLTPGISYTPVIEMSLAGDSFGGWKNPVYLKIKTQAVDRTNTVNYLDIQMDEFSDFSFPSFKISMPNEMITLTAKTKQEANLDSMLLFSNNIKIAEGIYTDPLTIGWDMQFSAKYDAAPLKPGFNYQLAIPLMLKGVANDGWREVVTLEVLLPNGKKYETTVDPKDIPHRNYDEFLSHVFAVNKSQGKITLNVITNQESNLQSALVVGPVKLRPSEHSA